jgi:protease PrsW
MPGRGSPTQLLIMLVSIGSFATYVQGTPWMVLVPAIVPAIVYSLIVITFTRYRRETGWLFFATLVCGAVLAAALSTLANDMTQHRLADVLGEARARVLTPSVAAPVLEELCKALFLLVVLLVRRASDRPMLDCIVYGALVGLGFAVMENINYFTLAAVQGGAVGLARSVYLRALLGGLNHAIFSGLVGAGIGGLLQSHGAARGLVWLAAGFCSASVQHMVWNAWASRAITNVLCGATDPGGACQAAPAHSDLFGTVPLIVVASIAPGLIAITLLIRNAARPMQRPAMQQSGSSLAC